MSISMSEWMHLESTGFTCLHIATMCLANNAVEYFLNHADRVTSVDTKTNLGGTALHLSCSHGLDAATPQHPTDTAVQTALIQSLLAHSASPVALDEAHNTPLIYAAQNSALGIMPLIINSIQEQQYPTANGIDLTNKSGEAPLHFAAGYGQVEGVQQLLAAGANPNIQQASVHGATPLHFATQQSHLRVLESLLQAGADPHYPDNRGQSSIQLASQMGHGPAHELMTKYAAK
jgi:ankyrin repeat protein